jgi:hypothetical protein
MRRKYSWRGKERKLRESVSMPTKRDNKPRLPRLTIWRRMPSMWSLNHQAEPIWILPGLEPSWKAAHHRAQHFQVVGVERVQDGLGQQPVTLQRVHESSQSARDLLVVDGVVAGVRPELGKHGAVQVANGSQVQLHGPAAAGVHAAHFQQHCRSCRSGSLPVWWPALGASCQKWHGRLMRAQNWRTGRPDRDQRRVRRGHETLGGGGPAHGSAPGKLLMLSSAAAPRRSR